MLLRSLSAIFFLSSAFARAETFGPYAEPEFPVLTSTVDFGDWGKTGFPKGNLAVRGLIIKLPHDCYVCFDTDLLRVAGIWQGEPNGKSLTFTSIASISYNVENRKSEPGQKQLPKPIGKPLLAAPNLPGWLVKAGGHFTPEDLTDPRPLGPDPSEPGRGPLPPSVFRWEGYDLESDGVTLRYSCGGTKITERFSSGLLGSEPVVKRHLSLSAPNSSLAVVTGRIPRADASSTEIHPLNGDVMKDFVYARPGTAIDSSLAARGETRASGWNSTEWNVPVVTGVVPGVPAGAFTVDSVALPVRNHWQRNVRPSGIAFSPDGTAFICTIDGDVWSVSGLSGSGNRAEWRRVAGGLHEPQSLAIIQGKVLVFTRNGIVRFDPAFPVRSYNNFCDVFSQTGETREYPMDMVSKPGGGFYIVKGGQEITRKSPQGGRVLEVSADGLTVKEIAAGLRQAYLGIHPVTGMLTASDQQGHWVPATPIHHIRPEARAYFGFEEAAPNPIPAVIQEPVCWIPHEVNQSAAGQVWCVNAKMGPLNDRLLHLSYFKPGIMVAFMEDEAAQGAVIPSGLKFDFPLLKGAVNPADGLLYVCGFRIWGTESKDMAGLARIRPSGQASGFPVTVSANANGIHLRFPDKLDAATCKPENFAAGRWNYKRTSNYGSAHYRLDGTPGMDPLPCTGVQISADGCGLLIHLPDMKPAQQLRLDWHLRSAAGTTLDSFACLTIREARPFDRAAAGFDPSFQPGPVPDISAAAASNTEPTADAGKQLVTLLGCLACHSTDGKMEGMKGPTWKDLLGSENELTTGKKVTADEAYLRESILNPAAKIRKGFNNGDVGMPPYAGILSDAQLKSVILYLRDLSNR